VYAVLTAIGKVADVGGVEHDEGCGSVVTVALCAVLWHRRVRRITDRLGRRRARVCSTFIRQGRVINELLSPRPCNRAPLAALCGWRPRQFSHPRGCAARSTGNRSRGACPHSVGSLMRRDRAQGSSACRALKVFAGSWSWSSVWIWAASATARCSDSPPSR
jgi:hypothetical protein